MKKIIILMFIVSLAFAGSKATPYIPEKGTIDSNVMRVDFSDDMQVLLAKYGKALQKNEKWFKEYSEKNKGKFPMPYHKNMGLSEKEYEKFKNISKSMTLVKKEKIVLTIKKDANSTTFLVKENPKHILNGIKIYTNGAVETKYGKLKSMTEVYRKRKSTGNWTGLEWTNNLTHAGHVQLVKFGLGKRDRGDYIIYYDVETFTPKSKRNYGYIIYKKESEPDMQKKLINLG